MHCIKTLKLAYTSEQILIILLTRLYFDKQKVTDVNDFLDKETINWVLFYELVSVNDIRGFIYEIIKRLQQPIDQAIFDSLKKDTAGIILFANYQLDLVTHLSTDFKILGITAIPYKGVTLASRYYKTLSMRESFDVDFLFNSADLVAIKEFLITKGFAPTHDVSKNQMSFLKKFHREISFIAPKNKLGISCQVELQWKLLENYFGEIYENELLTTHSNNTLKEPSQIGLPPTEDFLCVAAHHLISEPLIKFKYLIDLASIIQTSADQLDWKKIEAHFKHHNYSPFLWSGFSALKDVLGFNESLPHTPKVHYQLFPLKSRINNRNRLLTTLNTISLKLPLVDRIKFKLKFYSWFLIPNVNDLSLTNAPAWTIPFIIPAKFFKLVSSYLFKKR